MRCVRMNKEKLFVSFLLASLLVGQGYAETLVGTAATRISFLDSYNQYGGGDVIFKVETPIYDCYGYWISKTDPGFQANMSMLTAAYLAGTSVVVFGLADQLWSGSGNKYCKLHSVSYQAGS